MKSDGLMKTTSSKIFIERQQEISQEEMDEKLDIPAQGFAGRRKGEHPSGDEAGSTDLPRPGGGQLPGTEQLDFD